MPLVSIILPTFNRAATLKRAIASVLNQDYTNIELIVIDDGSTDNTRDILAEVNDKRVHIFFHDRNLGLGAARNTGLNMASGELVAFQDSDDEWLYAKLSIQVQALVDSPQSCVCVYCIKIVYGRDSDHVSGMRRVACVPGPDVAKVSGNLTATLQIDNLVSTQTILCRREEALSVGGFDPRLRNSVDWDFVLRLSEVGEFKFVNLPLVNTYVQEDSVSKLTHKAIYSQMIISNKMRRRGVPDRVNARRWANLGNRLGASGYPARADVLLRKSIASLPFSGYCWLRFLANRVLWYGRRKRLRPQ